MGRASRATVLASVDVAGDRGPHMREIYHFASLAVVVIRPPISHREVEKNNI